MLRWRCGMDEGEGTPSGCDLKRKKPKQARLRRPLQVVWIGAGRRMLRWRCGMDEGEGTPSRCDLRRKKPKTGPPAAAVTGGADWGWVVGARAPNDQE